MLQDEDRRCYSDSLLELPAVQIPRDDEVEVKMETKTEGGEGVKQEMEATGKPGAAEKSEAEQVMK